MTLRLLHVLCALLCGWLWLAPHAAWAQSGDEATPEALAAARKLFAEGKELEKQGDWAGALERFDTVAKVKMTPQVRFHIALCHEHLGRLVDAVNGFELAEQEARAPDARAPDVLENAPKRAEALRARVAHLTLEVEGTVYTSKVFLDGREVAAALFAKPIPVDPGDHVVEVKRSGSIKQREEIRFDEAEEQTLTLEIDDPEPAPPPDPEPAPRPRPQPRDEIPQEVDKPPQWVAYIVAGVGVAALAGAGIAWGIRQSELDEIAAACEDPENFKGCDERYIPTADAAETIDVTAKVLLAAGVVTVAAGVVLWFVLLPEDQPTTGKSRARVGIVPTPGGASLVGSF